MHNRKASNYFVFVSKSEAGHRREYIQLFEKYNGRRKSAATAWATRRSLLFLMIEEWFWLYLIVAIARAVFGLKTTGLLFRPIPAVRSNGARHKIKRLALRGLSQLKSVEIVSLVPFEVAPEIATIATDWIYDPQLFDWSGLQKSAIDEMQFRDRPHIKRRTTILSAGVQTSDKGIDALVAVAATNPDFEFIVAGKFSEDKLSLIPRLKDLGALVVDDYITDKDLLSLYRFSDLIWCAYSPKYDQASGILGRAIQCSKPVIVRAGSVSERLCGAEGHPMISIEMQRSYTEIASVDLTKEYANLPPLQEHKAARDFSYPFRRLIQRLASGGAANSA